MNNGEWGLGIGLMKLKKLMKLKDDTLGCGLHSAPYSAAKAIVL